MLDAEAIKAKLADVQGIEQLAFTLVGDRLVAAFNGRTTSVAHNANEDQMILAIRNAASLPPVADAPVVLNPQPLPTASPPAARKGPTMAASTGFAAQIRSMMDGARNRLAQAQAEGIAKVSNAVDAHERAVGQVVAVTTSMVQTIEDETAAALAELGQISNMPPVDGQ